MVWGRRVAKERVRASWGVHARRTERAADEVDSQEAIECAVLLLGWVGRGVACCAVLQRRF